MNRLIDNPVLALPAFSAEPPSGGGGGGGEAGGSGGSGEGGQAGAGPGAGQQAGSGAGSGAGDPPPAEGGPGQAASAAAGTPYRPEGLPETMFGASDRETMDKMAEALKGYRSKEAAVQIPSSAEGYHDFSKAEVPEGLQPFVDNLAQDPVFKAVGELAHANKWDPAMVQQITLTAFEAAQKGGFLTPLVDEAAERKALVPDTLSAASQADQDKAAKARVDAAENWINLQIKNEAIDKQIGEHAAMMLLDTADGVKFLEFVQQATGGGTGPAMIGAGGAGDTREALKAELKKPEMQPNHPKFDKQKYTQLQERYRKALS